jgi:hypothetical protein
VPTNANVSLTNNHNLQTHGCSNRVINSLYSVVDSVSVTVCCVLQSTVHAAHLTLQFNPLRLLRFFGTQIRSLKLAYQDTTLTPHPIMMTASLHFLAGHILRYAAIALLLSCATAYAREPTTNDASMPTSTSSSSATTTTLTSTATSSTGDAITTRTAL